MIKLDYALSPSWNEKTGSVALETAEEWVLRYDCFLGDVIFLVYEVDLSARWGWVPILDFALGLDSIVGSLGREDAEAEVFEFTESDATIAFRRDGEVVEIEASYVPGAARVAHEDLRTAVKRFVVRVLGDFARDHPELARNPFVAGVLETIASNG
jgi:hypothetical protein